MIRQVNRKAAARKRHYRLRRRLFGQSDCPRLAVHRSGKHIYAQVIDDLQSRTLAAASTMEKSLRESLSSGANIAAAEAVGKLVAERAIAAGIQQVVFDRGGYLYHGRIATLADAARTAGLQF